MSALRWSLWAFVLSGLLACGGTEPERPDSVILISLDTVRADHLGCYGATRETSPNLDAFAARSLLFERAISPAPWTLPAHASLLTGLYPNRHGVRTRYDALGPGVATLAALLSQRGFATGAFVNGLFLASSFGLDRGFDHYELVPPDDGEGGAAARVSDAALGWLSARRDDRVLLFVHYFDVHSDYRSRPVYERALGARRDRVDGTTEQMLEFNRGEREMGPAEAADLARLYDAGILQLDAELGRFFERLEASGWLARSLVVVFSDHGEQFLEHGKLLHTRNHHPELLHVPLLLRASSLPAGLRVAEPVSLVDVVPTLLALLGIEPPGDLDGVDLRPLWSGEEGAPPRAIFAETGFSIGEDTLRSLQDGRYKLIEDVPKGTRALYDVLADPAETRDLADERPEVAAALAERLARFAARRRQGARAPEMPEAIQQRLRALGYGE